LGVLARGCDKPGLINWATCFFGEKQGLSNKSHNRLP